jgi:hypothetical protein
MLEKLKSKKSKVRKSKLVTAGYQAHERALIINCAGMIEEI